MRRAMIALLWGLVFASAARADVVRLNLGNNLYGQGWKFLDIDGICKVVTAAHVIRALNGRIRAAMVLDPHGREWSTLAPSVVSTDPDVAILPISGANDPATCGEGRLSDIGVQRRVAEMSNGEIVTTVGTGSVSESGYEIIEVPVARRASQIDVGGGELFAVRPLLTTDRVTKGWSGSVVRDVEGPLGIVFEVDPERNEALAVRVDVVRRLLTAATAKVAAAPVGTGPLRPAIAVLAGSTVDPTTGPEESLARSGPGWLVLPRRRAIAFVANFPDPIQIHEVSIDTGAGSPNRIEGVDIATQAASGEEGWTSANYCRGAATPSVVNCRFLTRTVLRVRVVMKMQTDAPASVLGFAVR